MNFTLIGVDKYSFMGYLLASLMEQSASGLVYLGLKLL
jgi:hypothetical protein